MACSIGGSRIDYWNSLPHGASNGVREKLQHAQNRLARVVCKYGVRDHHTIDVRELHWLPVCSRIAYRIALTYYKTHRLGHPAYLETMLHQYVLSRSLRSCDKSSNCTGIENQNSTSSVFVYSSAMLERSLTNYLRRWDSRYVQVASEDWLIQSTFWLTRVHIWASESWLYFTTVSQVRCVIQFKDR